MNRWKLKVTQTPQHYAVEIGFAWPALVMGIAWLIWACKKIHL